MLEKNWGEKCGEVTQINLCPFVYLKFNLLTLYSVITKYIWLYIFKSINGFILCLKQSSTFLKSRSVFYKYFMFFFERPHPDVGKAKCPTTILFLQALNKCLKTEMFFFHSVHIMNLNGLNTEEIFWQKA